MRSKSTTRSRSGSTNSRWPPLPIALQKRSSRERFQRGPVVTVNANLPRYQLVAVLSDLVDIDHRRDRALDPFRRHDPPLTPHTALQRHHANAGKIARRHAQPRRCDGFVIAVGKPFRRADTERIEPAVLATRSTWR